MKIFIPKHLTKQHLQKQAQSSTFHLQIDITGKSQVSEKAEQIFKAL